MRMRGHVEKLLYHQWICRVLNQALSGQRDWEELGYDPLHGNIVEAVENYVLHTIMPQERLRLREERRKKRYGLTPNEKFYLERFDGRMDDLKKHELPECGARCRDGHSCRARVVKGKRRCRMHGGLSTGPCTPEGRQRIIESNQRRAQQKRLTNSSRDRTKSG